MTYNTDLMIQVREHIKMHPEQHNQFDWEYADPNSCGTTRCIAGWAIHLATGKSVNTAVQGIEFDGRSAFEQLGAELLGLDPAESHDLFFTSDEDRALAKLDALIEKGKNGE